MTHVTKRALRMALVAIGLAGALALRCKSRPSTGSAAPSATAAHLSKVPMEPSPVAACDARLVLAGHRPVAPAPAGGSGTVTTKAAGKLALSNATYHWAIALPPDWVVATDRGLELTASNPAQTACVHLLSMSWGKEHLPTARSFVDYWKKFSYGNVFPLYANGAQVSETELFRGRPGGPYLHYEFNDAKNGTCYLQVYASAGGPSSLLASARTRCADLESMRSALDGILGSASILP